MEMMATTTKVVIEASDWQKQGAMTHKPRETITLELALCDIGMERPRTIVAYAPLDNCPVSGRRRDWP